MKIQGKVAVWVFCLMFLAVIILQAGNYSYVQDNSHTNFGPSGTSAFLELTKQSGYQVTVDNTATPKVAPTMIIPVSFGSEKSFESFLKSIKSPTTIISFMIPVEEKVKPVARQLVNDVNSTPIGEIEPINIKTENWIKPSLKDAETVGLLSTQDNGTQVARVVAKGELRMIQLLDSSCLTNRHIEKVNNANVAMGLVAMAAKSGTPVTFVGTFASRNSEDSLLSKLGRPYEAAWSQLLILILVIFLTLSIRFGLAPESRAKQRGGRELVDGLAWMTRRKKSARWALRAVFEQVLAELERRHRVGREQIIQRPDLFLSPEAAVILKDVEAATMSDISEQEAIRHAKALKRLV